MQTEKPTDIEPTEGEENVAANQNLAPLIKTFTNDNQTQ